MNVEARLAPALNVLLAHMPDSSIASFEARDWHSSTFEGYHVVFLMDLSTGITEQHITRFLDEVPEFELPINGYFVADISANAISPNQIGVELLVLKE